LLGEIPSPRIRLLKLGSFRLAAANQRILENLFLRSNAARRFPRNDFTTNGKRKAVSQSRAGFRRSGDGRRLRIGQAGIIGAW
jgi:hypothetical protein